MGPSFPHQVTIKTPGSPRTDPVTRNQIPGAATTATSRAYLAARPVSELRAQFEVAAEQSTTVGMYDLMLPPGTVLTTDSIIRDEAGMSYVVSGRPVSRPHRNPRYVAASVRLISDLQR